MIAALLAGGADVHARNEAGETPCDLAVKHGMHTLMKLLGEQGRRGLQL